MKIAFLLKRFKKLLLYVLNTAFTSHEDPVNIWVVILEAIFKGLQDGSDIMNLGRLSFKCLHYKSNVPFIVVIAKAIFNRLT